MHCADIKILRRKAEDFFKRVAGLADFAYFDCVGALGAVRDFKRHAVAFAKLVKRNVHELVGVEKEISFLAIALDKPETLVSESGDNSFLHKIT